MTRRVNDLFFRFTAKVPGADASTTLRDASNVRSSNRIAPRFGQRTVLVDPHMLTWLLASTNLDLSLLPKSELCAGDLRFDLCCFVCWSPLLRSSFVDRANTHRRPCTRAELLTLSHTTSDPAVRRLNPHFQPDPHSLSSHVANRIVNNPVQMAAGDKSTSYFAVLCYATGMPNTTLSRDEIRGM